MEEQPQSPPPEDFYNSTSSLSPPPPPPPPSSVPQRVSNYGYDVLLADPPPLSFQVECPICLKVLRKPCVISCTCGKKACQECIDPIKTAGNPCPFCNGTNFTFMRDFGLERYLNDFEVLCEYRASGCEWSGKLGDFEKHINHDPSTEEAILEGCIFVPVKCRNCNDYYVRHELTEHQEIHCMKRPFTCKYCTTHNSTFEEVTASHYDICGSYPITCTQAGCPKEMKREELEGHLDNECQFAVEKCPYAFAGCNVELPRKDLKEHGEETSLHLKLLASFTQGLLSENQQLKEVVTDSNSKQTNSMEMLKLKLVNVQQSNRSLQAEMNRKNCLPIKYWVKRTNSAATTLPQFFSHYQGYKMVVKVYPNGHLTGSSTHLSVFVGLLRGPHDRRLYWPFRGKIVLQIKNQTDNLNHHNFTIAFNDNTPASCCNVSSVVGAGKEFGHPKVITQTELDKNFVQNGHIFIEVVRVDM